MDKTAFPDPPTGNNDSHRQSNTTAAMLQPNTQKIACKTNLPSPTKKTMGKEQHHEDIPDQHIKKKTAQKKKNRKVQKTGLRGDAEQNLVAPPYVNLHFEREREKNSDMKGGNLHLIA
jgi:hypothetical protein